jgi:hypothetical protein
VKESQENPVGRSWALFELPGSVLRWLSGAEEPAIDPLNKAHEAYGKLDENMYKAELELVDRYQSYVAELLRLSLLGIAVFGFLYKEWFAGLGSIPLLTIGGVAKTLAAFGVLAFGVAAVAALIFRFAATEGARYYIEGLRFREDIEDPDRAQKSLDKRRDRIVIARITKPTAVIMLGLGGALVALSLALLLLFSKPPPSQTADISKQVEEVSKLKDSGVITAYEFEKSKSKLLARL